MFGGDCRKGRKMTEAMNVLHPVDWSKEASRVLDDYSKLVR